MQSNRVVIDASVALKWFHEEPDTDRAEALQQRIIRGQTHAIVPSLFFYEVTNALIWKAGSSPDGILAAHRILEHLPFDVREGRHFLLEDAIRIAHLRRVSVYDAIYLACAITSDAVLITADKKFAEAVGSPNIILLSEMKE